MRRFAMLWIIPTLLAGPVFAQSGDADIPIEVVEAPPVSEARLAPARRYIQVVQTDQLTKAIEEAFDTGFQQNIQLPTQERDFIREQGLIVTRRALSRMFAEMTPLVAEVYTEAELEALIAFSDTPIGRSINAKAAIFGARQRELLQPIMQDMFREIMTKYCARFECPETPAGAARQKTPG